MKTVRTLVLVAAAALLLSGCFGYGAHMGWGEQGRHMERRDGQGESAVPCPEEGRRRPGDPPCPPAR
jgi:hypothetical protein